MALPCVWMFLASSRDHRISPSDQRVTTIPSNLPIRKTETVESSGTDWPFGVALSSSFSCPIDETVHGTSNIVEDGGGGGEGEKSSAALSPNTEPGVPRTKVIVIGAGVSGLSVAYHLMKLANAEPKMEVVSPSSSPVVHLDVEILEGRNRIGGRVESFRLDNASSKRDQNNTEPPIWIDLGGQWLHESSPTNPIRRLMEDDLDLSFVGGDDNFHESQRKMEKRTHRFARRKLRNVLFDQTGNSISKSVVQRARRIFYKGMNDLIDDDDDDHVLDDDGNLHRHSKYWNRTFVSYRDLIDARLQLERPCVAPANTTDTQRQRLWKSALNYFVHRSEENEGGRLDRVSALLADNLYGWSERVGEGPDLVVRGSYKALLDAVVAKLGLSPKATCADAAETIGSIHQSYGEEDDGNQDADERRLCRVRMRTNARVERIMYDGDPQSGSRVTDQVSLTAVETMPLGTRCDNDKTVTTEERFKMECDYCVCTVPLGVLKRGAIEFVPPLPPKRREAIDGIGMGILNKIIFRFDYNGSKPFWGDLLQFGICHEDPSMMKTYYDCTSDYFPENGSGEPPRISSAVLVQFLAGAAADRVDPPLSLQARGNAIKSSNHERQTNTGNGEDGKASKGLSDEEIIRESLEALRLVFGSDKVPNPVVSKVTRWRQDPWSCGSYSFAKVGSNPTMYDEIAYPLGSNSKKQGHLLFAGEHTSKHYHGTVHGAWETGQREAERIIQHLRNDSPVRHDLR